MTKNDIKHYTRIIPGIFRKEVYEYEDIQYTQLFDLITNECSIREVKMYNGINVCNVGEDGIISLHMPTEWVTNWKSMQMLIEDLKKLDEFLSLVCDNYKKR